MCVCMSREGEDKDGERNCVQVKVLRYSLGR